VIILFSSNLMIKRKVNLFKYNSSDQQPFYLLNFVSFVKLSIEQIKYINFRKVSNYVVIQ